MNQQAIHAGQEDVCETCKYFRHHDNGTGCCHRYPPSFAGDASPKANHHWRYPVVNKHNWCGEYRASGKP